MQKDVWNTDVNEAPDDVWLFGKLDGRVPYFVGKKYDMIEQALVNPVTGKWTQVQAWMLPPDDEPAALKGEPQ